MVSLIGAGFPKKSVPKSQDFFELVNSAGSDTTILPNSENSFQSGLGMNFK